MFIVATKNRDSQCMYFENGLSQKMASLCFSAVKYFQYTLVSVSMFPDICLYVRKLCVKFY